MREEQDDERSQRRSVFGVLSWGDVIALVCSVGAAIGSYNVFVERLARVEERIANGQHAQYMRDQKQDESLREMKTDIKDSLLELNRKVDRLIQRENRNN